MPFKRLIVIALLVLIALPSAASARPRFGIDPSVYPTAYPQLFQEDMTAFSTGARSTPMVRLVVLWSDIAPTRPTNPRDPADPAYRWSLLDTKVSAAYAGGVRDFIGVVFRTPVWASALRSQPAQRTANLPVIDAYADFLVAAQTRYAGLNGSPGIRNWEIWNEPNIGTNLQAPSRSLLVNHYSKMLRASRSALRQNAVALGIPAPVVIAGAIGGVTGMTHDGFIRKLSMTSACRGAKSRSCFDAVSIHPYSQNPRVDPFGSRQRKSIVSVGNFGYFVDVVNQAWPGRRTPIWVTEIGWQTNPPDTNMGVSYAKQASYMKKSYRDLSKFRQVAAVIWYGWMDEPQDATRRFGGWQSGIRTATGAKKPSWSAFRSVLR